MLASLAVKTSSSDTSTSSSSKELKNLTACETTSAKGLSQNQVLNCYSQAFAGNTTAITNNSTAPNFATGGSSSSTNNVDVGCL
ncbi:MAG: hypothetical protein WCF23_21310 [Candidatus Nitrosopolaris sp.]